MLFFGGGGILLVMQFLGKKRNKQNSFCKDSKLYWKKIFKRDNMKTF